jgi:AcrR family transcriptional regulator
VTEAALTPERILEAAEDVLRRYGPAKANVVDVARALGVSHGSVYRHFPSKAALRDAVTERWLAGISTPLEAVAEEESPAPERLPRWLDLLVSTKRRKALDDPELFATYIGLTAEAREVVKAHVDTLVGQLTRIIADGVTRRELETEDAASAARASSTPPPASTTPPTRPSGPTPRSTPPTAASGRSSSADSLGSGHAAVRDGLHSRARLNPAPACGRSAAPINAREPGRIRCD